MWQYDIVSSGAPSSVATHVAVSATRRAASGSTPSSIYWTRCGLLALLGIAALAALAVPATAIFVAVGDAGGITTSPDGVAWTSRCNPGSGTGCVAQHLYGVDYGTDASLAPLWVAVGQSGTIMSSPNGVTWNTVCSAIPGSTTTCTTADLRAVAYGEDELGLPLWVAVGGNGYGGPTGVAVILTSPDGQTWTNQVAGSCGLDGVAYNELMSPSWVAVGQMGCDYYVPGFQSFGAVLTSTTGLSWAPASQTGAFQEMRGVASDGLVWVGVGGTNLIFGPGNIFVSANGQSWAVQPQTTARNFNGVAFNGQEWLAVSDLGSIWTSPNGAAWVPVQDGGLTGLNSYMQWPFRNFHAVAFGANRWVIVGGGGTGGGTPIIRTSLLATGTWATAASGTAQTLRSVAWSDPLPIIPPPPPPPPPMPPMASAAWDQLTPCVFDVQFTDQSTPGAAAIVQWEWDFGDASAASTLQHPMHSYSGPGVWNVDLTVTDGNGETDTTSLAVLLCSPPMASFFTTLVAPCGVHYPYLSFHDASTDVDGPILAWSWTFDDGTTSTSPDPYHTWGDLGGLHVVQLEVFDAQGASHVIVMTVTAPLYEECPYAFGDSMDLGPSGMIPTDGIVVALANADADQDGVAAAVDNCVSVFNPGQADADGDLFGDSCDADIDGDGIANGADDCMAVANHGQADRDLDGLGDACDQDADQAGALDSACSGVAGDGCPTAWLAANVDEVQGDPATRGVDDGAAPHARVPGFNVALTIVCIVVVAVVVRRSR